MPSQDGESAYALLTIHILQIDARLSTVRVSPTASPRTKALPTQTTPLGSPSPSVEVLLHRPHGPFCPYRPGRGRTCTIAASLSAPSPPIHSFGEAPNRGEMRIKELTRGEKPLPRHLGLLEPTLSSFSTDHSPLCAESSAKTTSPSRAGA